MNLSACYYLGYISRVIEARKQLVLKLDVDHPENYLKLESVLIQLHKADENPVPFFIAKITGLQKDELTVELNWDGSTTDLVNLKGKSLYLPLSRLPVKGENDYYYHEIIGFEAVDEATGPIGTILDVIDLSVHPVLSIDHQGTEVLAPLYDGAFIRIDRVKKQFHLRIQEGLLDIYLNPSEISDI